MTKDQIILELIIANLYAVDEDSCFGSSEDYNLGFMGKIFSIDQDEYRKDTKSGDLKIYAMIMDCVKEYETRNEEK